MTPTALLIWAVSPTPTTPSPPHVAGPKDIRGKERVKDRKQTLASVFVCQELYLATGTG